MIVIMDRRELLVGHKISDMERRIRELAEALGRLKPYQVLGREMGSQGRPPDRLVGTESGPKSERGLRGRQGLWARLGP